MFPRPCADEGPSVPPGLAPAAAASSRIDTVTTSALFFMAMILFAGTL